jgi:ABC-type multidrug transport system ATPase subunit
LEISLEKTGKRYQRSWIFRNLDWNFHSGQQHAILGPNGSGKSTLLQVVAGYITPTRGSVAYKDSAGKNIPVDRIFGHLSMAAPYLDLPEELNLNEMLSFHTSFKVPLLNAREIIDRLQLSADNHKEIRFFSSGMKQRVKLALAILFESDIILLDEPTSHLDKNSTQWYRDLVQEFSPGRTLIISSNQPEEYDFCPHLLDIRNFK